MTNLATRRISEADMLRMCAASGQMDSRQMAAHIKASEMDGIGVECALPIIVDDIKPAREIDWQAVVLVAAVAFTWLAILALSIADPRDLSTLWPRLVALASF
jgi:hypothetical protein